MTCSNNIKSKFILGTLIKTIIRYELIMITTNSSYQCLYVFRCRKFPPPISKIIIIDDFQSLIISIEISCFRAINLCCITDCCTLGIIHKIFCQPFLLTNLYNHMIHAKDFFTRERNGRCRGSFFRFGQLATIFYTKNRKKKTKLILIVYFYTNNFAFFHLLFEHNDIHSILVTGTSPIHSAVVFFIPILIKEMTFQNIFVLTI